MPKAYRNDIRMSWWQRGRQVARSKILFKAFNCCSIGVLDEGAYNGMVKKLDRDHVFLLPDVTDEKLPAERRCCETVYVAIA